MVIRMRHTRAHTKNRRSHHALTAPEMVVCKNCSAKHRPHHMCLECGFYNGRQVMDLTAKKAAREARMQAKRDAITAQAEQISPSEAEEVTKEAPQKSSEKNEVKDAKVVKEVVVEKDEQEAKDK